jgi:hypothetical protein
METRLHRELKSLYSDDESQQEVTLDGYRIDVVSDGRLVEIQYGSLAAIREKICALVEKYDVLIVKPLAARKFLVNKTRRGGPVKSARYSPTRQNFYNLFDDLVHFVGVFPHPRLTLEVILTEQEEHRLPAGRRRWRRKGYRVEDRLLRTISDRLFLRTADDLLALLPKGLSGRPFTTADIASKADIPRWLAQKMAYCLRETGAVDTVGKQGNTLIYEPRGLQDVRAA